MDIIRGRLGVLGDTQRHVRNQTSGPLGQPTFAAKTGPLRLLSGPAHPIIMVT
jgi:hypothetical protein